MAKTNNLGDFLKDIADGIRSKKGIVDDINAQDFRDEIESIVGIEVVDTLEDLEELDATEGRIVEVLEGEPCEGETEVEKVPIIAMKSFMVSKNGSGTSSVRWECSTSLFNKPIFIDDAGNLYAPNQIGLYFGGTYKTQANVSSYTFGTYTTLGQTSIEFKTLAGFISVSLILLEYYPDVFGTNLSIYLNGSISWSSGGGQLGVIAQNRWSYVYLIPKTWLNSFSDITENYMSDTMDFYGEIGNTVIANGSALSSFIINMEDPD